MRKPGVRKVLSPPFTRSDHLSTKSFIERPRLLAKLQGAESHKLTLISAPPGYGKTTLVSQFARQTAYPLIWHTLEDRERDVPNLYTQSLSLLDAVAPGISKLPLPYGYAPGELATAITSFLRHTLSSPIFYVFDDAHQLTESTDAETWLRTFVTTIPPNCHIILISRTLPDLPLVEMIARREIMAIGQEELRFTAREIEDLAQKASSSVPAAQVAEITERLEGWAAGTVLALQPMPADFERAVLREHEAPEALFDALADQMFGMQPPHMQSFLLASATLTRITPELCTNALLLPNAAALLIEAQERNLFLNKASGGLVYHTLFRSFLQRRLKETDPDLFAELHTHVGSWFEAQNAIDESFNHYYLAGRFDRAARVAEGVAQAYFAQGKIETLLNWEAQLNTTQLSIPRLLYSCALIHTDRYEYADAEIKLNRIECESMLSEATISAEQLQLQRAMIHLQRGDYATAVTQAEPFIVEVGITPHRYRALNILGVAYLRLGEVARATAYLEEALPLFRASADAHALSQLLQNLGAAYSRLGRLTAASACLQEVVALRRSLGGAAALALALNNLGYYYHQCNDYKHALSTLQEGLSVVARFPSRRAETYLLWSLGDVQRDRGAFETALNCYMKALDLVGDKEPPLRCLILTSTSTLYRWHGKHAEAIRYAEQSAQLAERNNQQTELIRAEAALWATRAEMGQAADALAHIQTLIADLSRGGTRLELIRLFGLCANVALLMNDMAQAGDFLRKAFEQGQDMGSLQLLVAEVIHSARLEVFILKEARRYEPLLRELLHLRAEQAKAEHEAPRFQKLPNVTTFGLRVLTLGRENILRDSVPIATSEWRATAARELFFYLLFVGPASREQISLAFWPDTSTQRVRSNFHTTLYRARHALGENTIHFEDGIYLINPAVDVWCDAQELETLVIQARLLSPNDARTEDLWRRGLELYKGEFLGSLETIWIGARREGYYNCYIEALIGLGECARARRDFRQALDTFQKALEFEPYREDIHRAIMTCYAQRGDKYQLNKHLHELKMLLREELDAEPSTETLDLAQSLLG